ncbi:MAG: hypothetical protein WAN65_18995 [Candidatus Sulfotelmatobacter sp.]
MTLAIGMQCRDSVILAADTLMSYDGGPISEGQKLTGFCSGTGSFAMAQSSYDAHAADTLMSEIRANVEAVDPKTFPVLERAVKDAMANWYAPVYENRPAIQLLMSACLKEESERGLYVCEPPSVASRVWESYKAIGDGRTVSDPIYNAWFKQDAPWPLHTSLCQLSYMMHKGKQLLPASVGGSTDVAVLTEAATVPYWIERMDMADAEARGRVLDRIMSRFTSLVMAGNMGGVQAILKMAEGIYQGGLHYATLEFRCQFPNKTVLHH